MKTVLVTDVHGCIGEFRLLLQRVSFDEKVDKLIFLGDMLDRGFHSYRTFREFQRLKEVMGSRFILCRGNHDQAILFPPMSWKERLKWMISGRILSDINFFRHHSDLSEVIPFMENNTVLYHSEKKFQCVHASIEKERLSENSIHTLLYDHHRTRRNVYGGKLTITGHIHELSPKYYDGKGGKGEKLDYGVWKDLPEKGVICIDTGCAEMNRLTAMVVEEGRFLLESVKRGSF